MHAGSSIEWCLLELCEYHTVSQGVGGHVHHSLVLAMVDITAAMLKLMESSHRLVKFSWPMKFFCVLKFSWPMNFFCTVKCEGCAF